MFIRENKNISREQLRQIFYDLIQMAENEAKDEMEENDYEIIQGHGYGTYNLGYITEEDLDEIYDAADDCGVYCWIVDDLHINPNRKYELWVHIEYNKFNGYGHPTWGLERID